MPEIASRILFHTMVCFRVVCSSFASQQKSARWVPCRRGVGGSSFFHFFQRKIYPYQSHRPYMVCWYSYIPYNTHFMVLLTILSLEKTRQNDDASISISSFIPQRSAKNERTVFPAEVSDGHDRRLTEAEPFTRGC